jgi:sugar transferase (PEP-CTERM system associated)
VIRLFNVYYPVRTLVLLVGEALIVCLSFVLGTMWAMDSWLRFNNDLFIEGGVLRIVGLTGIVLLLSHGFDLYDSSQISARTDQAFRLLFVLGLVALVLGGVLYFIPSFLPGKNSAIAGVIILAIGLFGWRSAYSMIARQPFFRERVYVLGTGERAERVVKGLRERSELGIEVVGWTGNIPGELTRESVASDLLERAEESGVHRVIVAMPDRRGTLPVEELLALRLAGVKVEEATSWLEKITGRIEVEHLYPSWLIFADGFRFSGFFRLVRRVLNFVVALLGSVLALPLIPFIVLLVKLDSPGPALYKQIRVGRGGKNFYCYKFRTMRQDAEADRGATWATDDDPRITRGGKFLRSSRLDEIPQLWCVLKGDMHFVGPRPERPEFVEWLSREIPYYGVRHVVRPGITGWAQVQYKYGNTLEDAREKLQYDLFYIKNASIGLDLLIWFQSVKIVLLGRGAK